MFLSKACKVQISISYSTNPFITHSPVTCVQVKVSSLFSANAAKEDIPAFLTPTQTTVQCLGCSGNVIILYAPREDPDQKVWMSSLI